MYNLNLTEFIHKIYQYFGEQVKEVNNLLIY